MSTGNTRAPGVYISHSEPPKRELSPVSTKTPCFVGIAEKGPLNVPVQIGTWEQFSRVFGTDARHFLTPSVELFFRNGGTNCFIIRVAHVPEPGEEADTSHAACSEVIANDTLGKPTLRLAANSEGMWGNELWVKIENTDGTQSLVTRDIEPGAGEATMSSTRGFKVGDLVRIHSSDKADHVVLTDVSQKRLAWGPETPVSQKHAAAAPTYATRVEFEVHVALQDKKEVHRGLQMHPSSPDYVEKIIKENSALLHVTNLRSNSAIPKNCPKALAMTKLAGGRNGIEHLVPMDFIGSDLGPAARTGLQIIKERDEISMVSVPDAMFFASQEPGPSGFAKVQRVQDALVDMCELTKYQFAILDIPQTKNLEDVKAWRNRVDSSYCAFYWPWLSANTSHGVRSLPPSGAMAGLFASTEREEGVHVAAANKQLAQVEDVDLQLFEEHFGELTRIGVNSFKSSRALGVRPWGARTASRDPEWRFVPVRRLFIMLRKTLDHSFGWVPFESNSPKTWERLEKTIEQMLVKMHEKGMFAAGNSDDAFYVKCDDETNPPENIESGKLLCQIGVAPSAPAEFIIIDLEQEMLTT